MKILFPILLVCILLACQSNAQESTVPKVEPALVKGPEKGTLFIVGGGRLSDRLIDKFIELAGGEEAPIVVIPTAGGAQSYSDDRGNFFRDRGAKHVTVLHTTDPKEADTEAFVEPLLNAKAVWFSGGRQWRLVDAYAGTKAEKLFWEVLNRGGVIGGSSAGATIQGSYLARGDTKNNQIMMGDHEEGFGFLQNVAIDQHVLARNRQFDLFNILEKRPELLGIGIDENTAMIVQQDEFEVMGASYVLIYDSSFWSREGSNLKILPPKKSLFYMLRDGDKYDLANRVVIRD